MSRPRIIPLRRELAQRRTSQELKLCSANIDLSLEDDAPRQGQGLRAVFKLDINNPCWIFPQAELDSVTGIEAAVGQIPFNFQIGEDVKKIRFATPTTAEGELEVRLGTCEGDVIARLPWHRTVSQCYRKPLSHRDRASTISACDLRNDSPSRRSIPYGPWIGSI